ncbi:putative bacteriocin precursor [Clostridium botulinum]|uniref:CLI_3235 family bacteriocin precursor n=1 Tax=Clostridium botulinum TaxID=1491 RepID=UPI001401982E|nr:CLI_3235 family bacteriocin precursor [Clostridium botulinum]MBY6914833.1 CLI_3235 family bacteriocin precursor [Clostridium botulinum]NFO38859.1 putative bacteriocin precursor [Clostridium botulinum]NFQ39706.1 putative bacteriocin precursor [Clostridium botulinum]
MKKLGKKKLEIMETIEAYDCSCTDKAFCRCSSESGKAYALVNNDVYAGVYARSKKD